MRRRIAVIGSDDSLNEDVKAMAYMVGQDVAKRGCILVCGGRSGVMEAACKGAKETGGLTIGILPSLDGKDANPYVDVLVTTGLGYARNSLVVSSADAVIAIAGSSGTLSEIGMALNFGRPIVAVKGSGGVADRIRHAFPNDKRMRTIIVADAENAVEVAFDAIED